MKLFYLFLFSLTDTGNLGQLIPTYTVVLQKGELHAHISHKQRFGSDRTLKLETFITLQVLWSGHQL